MDELLLKIHQLLPDMNATERKIADYVLEQPYELIQLPLRELASAIGVSQAAWVRFFKLLGFSGLKEVKQAISSSLLPEKAEEEEGAVYGDIIGFDSQDQLFRSLVEQEIRSLRETAQILDYSQLEKAAHAIRTASRVAFFGVGASGLVALDALHKFARIGIHVAACMDLHLQLTVASTLQKGDVAVLISHSGRTKDTLDILETAKKKGRDPDWHYQIRKELSGKVGGYPAAHLHAGNLCAQRGHGLAHGTAAHYRSSLCLRSEQRFPAG